MGLESPTYINQLNPAWPIGATDDRSTADDHLRAIKAAVLNTFPAITGAVSASHTELNLNVGNTETIGAKLVQFSLSISAINTNVTAISNTVSVIAVNVAAISNTVSVMNARLVSMSALNTGFAADLLAHSNTISVIAVNVAAISNTVSVMSLKLASISALNTGYTASLLAHSNTISVMAVRINTLSVSVSVVQAAVAAFPATERTWSAQQVASSGSLTDSASVAWDCDADGQIVSVTLAGNRTMEAPTNVSENAMYVLKCIQDATGSRTLTWNAAYYFAQGVDAVLSTTASAIDIFSFLGGPGGVMYCTGYVKGVA